MTQKPPNQQEWELVASQNALLWSHVQEQRAYITALTSTLPESLLKDLNLPSLPSLPPDFELWTPKRLLDVPIESHQLALGLVTDARSPTESQPQKASQDRTVSRGLSILEHYDEYSSGNAPLELLDTEEPPPPAIAKSPRMFPRGSRQHSQGKSEKKPSEARLPDTPLGVSVLSTVKLNKGKESMAVILSVIDKATLLELWQVEKQFFHFAALDFALRKKVLAQRIDTFPLMPDRSLFQTFAPFKCAARREAIERYLNASCLYFKEERDLIDFLQSDHVDTEKESNLMQGYLYKRGKTLGIWKARYHILHHGLLLYSEMKDGEISGNIDLKNTKVVRHPPIESPTENDHCHAFIITEYKPASSSSRSNPESNSSTIVVDMKPSAKHILCCENDQTRDLWVQAICQEILKYRPRDWATLKELSAMESKNSNQGSAETGSKQAPGSPSITPKRPPIVQARVDSRAESSSPVFSYLPYSPSTLSASAENPMSVKERPPLPPRSDSALKPSPMITDRDDMMTLGRMATQSSAIGDESDRVQCQHPLPLLKDQVGEFLHTGTVSKKLSTPAKDQRPSLWKYIKGKDATQTKPRETRPNRIFGVSLIEAVSLSRMSFACPIPAIVYRCIEYLEHKKVWDEEGIYRLSGSSAEVAGLKMRFEEELDVDLLEGDQYYDPHAIAGLLKLYFRELPTHIFDADLKTKLSEAADAESREDKIKGILDVINLLPTLHYILLRTLQSHLLRIVKNAGVNKMSVRNLSIVFSPTLNIPTHVFSLLITDFDAIFQRDIKKEDLTSEKLGLWIAHGDDDGTSSISSKMPASFEDVEPEISLNFNL